MMSQQINLLNPALIKQKDFLNLNTILVTLGILLALMLGYYSYVQKQYSKLSTQRSLTAQALVTAQARLQQATLLHTPHEINKALLEQIAQLEQKQAMQQRILQTVNQSTATPEKGYAALMRAFAKQNLDGVWLTSFSFDSKSERLSLSGRALDGSLVPEYIAHLGNEPVLQGKKFTSLLMNQAKKENTSNTASSPVATLNNNHLTASITKNGISTLPNNMMAVEDNAQTNVTHYIEFSLQSTEDKSVATTIDNKPGEKL